MSRKLVERLVVVLAVMLAVSTLALAAEKATVKKSQSQTLMGTVASLDAKKGMLTLKTMDGKSMPFKVARKSLKGLQVGDQVKVEMVGKHVKAIEKEKMEEKMEEKKS